MARNWETNILTFSSSRRFSISAAHWYCPFAGCYLVLCVSGSRGIRLILSESPGGLFKDADSRAPVPTDSQFLEVVFGHALLYPFKNCQINAWVWKKNLIRIFVMHKISPILLLPTLQALIPEALNQLVFLEMVNTFTPPINVFILLSCFNTFRHDLYLLPLRKKWRFSSLVSHLPSHIFPIEFYNWF